MVQKLAGRFSERSSGLARLKHGVTVMGQAVQGSITPACEAVAAANDLAAQAQALQHVLDMFDFRPAAALAEPHHQSVRYYPSLSDNPSCHVQAWLPQHRTESATEFKDGVVF